MDDIFHYIEYDEQLVASKGVKSINTEKNTRFIINSIIGGFVFLFTLLIFAGLYYSETAGRIKRYHGSKPQFEDYEDYIMSGMFNSSIVTDQAALDAIDFTDPNSMYLVSFSTSTTYSQVKTPSEYDFSNLDFNKIDSHRKQNFSTIDLPKNTDSYKSAAKEAKELFDKEIDSRASQARKIFQRELLICLIIFALFVAGLIYWWKRTVKTGELRLEQIEKGKCYAAKGTLIGREKIRRYRRESSYTIEVETEDEQRWTLTVKSMHYESFESGKPCYLIKYDEDYAAYDEYDVVWDGLEYEKASL